MSNREEQLILAKIEAMRLLVEEIKLSREQRQIELEWFRSHCHLATKSDLKEMEKRIMSKIGDWAAIVGPKLDSIQTGIDALQALVEQLQNSPGTITPEDQALLDQIQAKVEALAADAGSVPTPPANP